MFIGPISWKQLKGNVSKLGREDLTLKTFCRSFLYNAESGPISTVKSNNA